VLMTLGCLHEKVILCIRSVTYEK